MANTTAAPPQFYSQEQVQQILNVAIARQASDRQASDDAFSREQLFKIAEELEISPQCLAQAEQAWLSQQSESEQRLTFNAYRQDKLKAQGVRFAITSSGLLAINALMGFGVPWAVYLICLMTARLGWRAWIVFQQNEEDYERAFRHWARKRQLSQVVNRWWMRILST